MSIFKQQWVCSKKEELGIKHYVEVRDDHDQCPEKIAI